MAAGIVIVGGGLAGGTVAAHLQEEGYSDPIVVIDDDPDAPYDRPPLSKDFLSSERHAPDAPWWPSGCTLVRGRAISLDPEARLLNVSREEDKATEMSYDHLVVATGTVPTSLPGEPLGVARLGSAAEARTLRPYAAAGKSVIVIGAGTVGTELASTLAEAGARVTLVGRGRQPLARFFGGHLGTEAAAWIRGAGVDLRLGERIEKIVRRDGRWRVSVGSEELTSDMIVSAIGVRPNTDWLSGSGLHIADGVLCDSHGTALNESGQAVMGVHAVGDVARWQGPGGARRREDWTSARRQGITVANAILGREPGESEKAKHDYFWTHQFGRRIQVLGNIDPNGELVLHVERPEHSSSFYTVENSDGTRAYISINSPQEFVLALSGRYPNSEVASLV